MTKKPNKLDDLMAKKNPNALRQPIQSVDILAEATAHQNRSERANEKIPQESHSTKPFAEDRSQNRSETANEKIPQESHSIELVPKFADLDPSLLGEEKSEPQRGERGASPENAEQADPKNKETRSLAKNPATKNKKNERLSRSEKERRKPHVFTGKEIEAVLACDVRPRERYSFEIYTDQKADIQRVCDLYEQKTGKKLSASRLIREVLDTFLPDAIKTFASREEENRTV